MWAWGFLFAVLLVTLVLLCLLYVGRSGNRRVRGGWPTTGGCGCGTGPRSVRGLNVLTFDTSSATGSAGTFVVPAGVHSLNLEMWGGGGGGASFATGTTHGGGGGGAGAYLQREMAVRPGDAFTITVGPGGAPDTAALPGGTTIVTSSNVDGLGAAQFIAYGGLGGDLSAGGEGGIGTSSQTGAYISGGGQGAFAYSPTGLYQGGAGGGAAMGGAGGVGGVGGASPAVASPGVLPGGGGGGAGGPFTLGEFFPGGPGADGSVRITYVKDPSPADFRHHHSSSH